MKNPKLVLGVTYYVLLILALCSAMFGYWLIAGPGVRMTEQQSHIAYNIMLWTVIITLPGSLTLFRLGVKQLSEQDRTERTITLYTRYALARMLVIGLGLIASIVVFYTSGERSMFWLAAMEAVGLVFCKPTNRKIERDLGTDDDEEETDESPVKEPAQDEAQTADAPQENTEEPAATDTDKADNKE